MTAFSLNYESFTSLKRAAHVLLPTVKSSHLAEALAAAFGYRTYASLLADFQASAQAPQEREADAARFSGRLTQFGYPASLQFPVELLLPDEAAPTPEDFSEPGLFTRTPTERCRNYGVSLRTEAPGRCWAWHLVGGAVGPCATEEQAAQEACEKLGL